MADYPAPSEKLNGCGLVGCAGGLILGACGAIALALITALILAITGSVPQLAATSAEQPDIQVSLTEDFLNRFIEQPASGSIAIDILPNNQTQIVLTTPLEAFGLMVPVRMIGLFQIQASQQSLQVSLVDTRVSGFNIDLTEFFQEDALTINQNLQTTIDEMSSYLGAPIVITGLRTNDTQIQIDLKEMP